MNINQLLIKKPFFVPSTATDYPCRINAPPARTRQFVE
ncbi:hypothetical protein DDI_1516 [Dickeya dianthicola RNS04.9]|nr:hypothetical protein DDI_1516 [Dickeya dianthicola RNS04.9]